MKIYNYDFEKIVTKSGLSIFDWFDWFDRLFWRFRATNLLTED